MDTTATILAVSSAPGRSLRGIVRCSGTGAFDLFHRHLDTPVTGDARRIAPTRFSWSGHSLPVQVLAMPGPGSATGEDVIELQLPGHPDLLARIIDALIDSGQAAGLEVRRAEPGEFTARAFFNGRCSLTEAEGVAATIAASSDAQLRAAGMLRSGKLGLLAADLAERIASVLALVEAGIDFSDEEDVVAIEPRDLLERLGIVHEKITSVLDRSVAMERLQAVPHVVLCGRSNAGKSTLFNVLLGHRRAVVSDQLGTTRDVLSEPLHMSTTSGEDLEVMLVDLAGLDGTNPSPLHRRMQDAAQEAIDCADLLLACCAVDDPVGADGLPKDEARVVHVLTKADLGESDEHAMGMLQVSALTGQGLEELLELVQDRLEARAVHLAADAMALQPRHEAELRTSLEAIDEAMVLVEPAARDRHLPSSELVAASLRRGLDATSSLAGAMTPDDILGRIFAGFCIGK